MIAVDYDGAIARNDMLDPAVRPAIAAARTNGITVLLVTGRILDWRRLRDYPLAAELRALEERHRASVSPDTVPEIVAPIRGRYDLVHDEQVLPAH